jgi:hypothetical protein
MFPLGCVADTFDTTRCDERPFLGMVLHDASLGVFALIIALASICSSSYSLISLPPVVLLVLAHGPRTRPPPPAETNSTRTISPPETSTACPTTQPPRALRCRVQDITMMGSKTTGSRSGRPLYIHTFHLSLVFFSHHLISQYTYYFPTAKSLRSPSRSVNTFVNSLAPLAASRLQDILTDLCLLLRYAKIPRSIGGWCVFLHTSKATACSK